MHVAGLRRRKPCSKSFPRSWPAAAAAADANWLTRSPVDKDGGGGGDNWTRTLRSILSRKKKRKKKKRRKHQSRNSFEHAFEPPLRTTG